MSIEWLAGLLEGEGCFGRYGKTPKQSHLQYARMSLAMTDEDVVRRAHEFAQLGHVSSRVPRETQNKKVWIWQVNGKEAEELMRLVRPYMGERRGARIDEVLACAP